MNQTCARRDWVRNSKTMWLFWGVPAVITFLAFWWAGDGWIVTMSWTLSLAVMGAACLVNARSCGRMHCYFTGPFFLLMAIACLAYGLRWLSLGSHGWLYLGAVLLAGNVLLGFGPEWRWGRYRAGKAGSNAR